MGQMGGMDHTPQTIAIILCDIVEYSDKIECYESYHALYCVLSLFGLGSVRSQERPTTPYIATFFASGPIIRSGQNPRATEVDVIHVQVTFVLC